MESFSAIPVFVAVVECGSFSLASEQLGVTKSAVSKRISQLEAKRGARTDEWTHVEAAGPSGGLYSPAELRRRAEAPR